MLHGHAAVKAAGDQLVFGEVGHDVFRRHIALNREAFHHTEKGFLGGIVAQFHAFQDVDALLQGYPRQRTF